MKTPLRMGRISFLNVLPIYHPLEAGIIPHEYELVAGPPALLNKMMARGELQVSSCSCIEYARNFEKYYLVRDLSIGSAGPVLSVLLLSRVPMSELDGEEVLISGESHTSVALLKLLLNEYYEVQCRFRVGHVGSELAKSSPLAFLAIGDEALRLRHHPEYPVRMDLAEAWREWTGKPFIFGLWIIDAAFADSRKYATNPGDLLRNGRDWGLEHMDVILDLTGHGCPLNREELRKYYEEGLFFTLKDSELAGLRLFYEKIHAAGMIPHIPQLRFL